MSRFEALALDGYDASRCPRCGEKTTVTRTGPTRTGYLMRSRLCEHCNERYHTVEVDTGWAPRARPRQRRQMTVILERSSHE